MPVRSRVVSLQFHFTLVQHAPLTSMSFNESPGQGGKISSYHFEDALPSTRGVLVRPADQDFT